MSGVKCRKWTLKSHFCGAPKREDLEIVEVELPAIKDGEYLCEALWLSVDPYMRFMSNNLPLGDPMFGGQVARVIQSKNKDFSEGDLVVGLLGWNTHTIIAADRDQTDVFSQIQKLDPALYKDRESTALGVLGMPGAAAYFGVLEVLAPKEGQTLVINGAAGAVGSLVGQIAKIKGCRVVGFAGSDAKVDYLKKIGFDAAYNYKTIASLKDTLKEACPNGIDLFFDNVGGDWFETVLAQMNLFGKVAVCGDISQYNAEGSPKGHYVSHHILWHQLKIEGFNAFRFVKDWPVGFKQMHQWISEGKLKYEETVTEGFDNMFEAFSGLFTGANIGKAVVKA